MKNIFYFRPGVQHENTGDALINMCAVRCLLQYGEVTVLRSGMPDNYLSQIRAPDSKILDGGEIKGILTLMKLSFCQWAGGRGQKCRYYYVLPPGHVQRDGIKPAVVSIKNVIVAFFLKLFSVSVCRFGVSLNGKSALNGYIESFLSRFMLCYGLRDSASLAYAEKYSFRNAVGFPDFAWVYESGASSPNVDERQGLVLSFRANASGRKFVDNYLNEHIAWIKNLISSPSFAERIYLSYQVEFDKVACYKIRDELESENPFHFIDKKLSVIDAFALYSSVRLVISNRLHVLILAGIAGAIPLALIRENDNIKIKSLFDGVGLSDFVLTLGPEGGNKFDMAALEAKASDDRFIGVAVTMKNEIHLVLQKLFG
jgi:hypothetical protein